VGEAGELLAQARKVEPRRRARGPRAMRRGVAFIASSRGLEFEGGS
jgi:hypothetical protein